jgi:hypothetical protein
VSGRGRIRWFPTTSPFAYTTLDTSPARGEGTGRAVGRSDGPEPPGSSDEGDEAVEVPSVELLQAVTEATAKATEKNDPGHLPAVSYDPSSDVGKLMEPLDRKLLFKF